jgi:hypothetical protein
MWVQLQFLEFFSNSLKHMAVIFTYFVDILLQMYFLLTSCD